MKKTVTFEPIDTIYYTYSSEEYDRSYFAYITPCIKYTFRPMPGLDCEPIKSSAIPQKQQQCNGNRPPIAPLDLSVIPNSRRRVLNSPVENSSSTKKSRNKPNLSINTKLLPEGPLFFTGLSTHYKYKEEEEEDYGYLIPVSAC
ncbi:hypothetical protein BCV72DRAFT_223744 [Rhizopus microsporus var. microsporus]|uniref:Uncharacterized protein n=2 Tax=Rhizopus microsporus TaxID=58291 RepID=A0A2G4T841_RHIZD|nr:uncharacterized protein RHIMIDRAFT_253270 [Rhizopus microsporus ATCC 52813]ORE09228.1 hypothetical protein BCV72DRAFT_223744 [Rhizopus microsporus var. microsporus]PHZ17192.1 hypothetical protein RHIMIDRAFT_253270 [Rhizopus microsporus ATCC 52813]